MKLIINYSIGDESIVGQKINAVMGIYNRINGTLIKLSSFPDGIILNNTAGTIQLASTLTDPKIQNISTIVTLTNADKSEKYLMMLDRILISVPYYLPPCQYQHLMRL